MARSSPILALLLLPLALERVGTLADVGELALERLEPRLRCVVLLLAQRLALDLELDPPALELVQFDGHRIHLHPQPAGRLVDQVDRLVGQEAVGDVAVAQHRGGDERGVGDPHAVVVLVALTQAAQDRDRLLDGRLVDEDRLEAALEGGVLLDVLAVLVERGRADRVQLAAREHRLEQVGRVHRALGRAGADDRVQLVDEQDDLALGVLDLLEDGLEALLELAAELRAGDERAQVEPDDALVLEPLGHVAADDALGEALDDRGLADARLADQHRVVLGPAREDLDDAPDLLVAADDRVELAARASAVRSRPYLLERLVGALRVLAGDALSAADRFWSAPRIVSCVAPACSRMRCASPPACDAARSRCSVETYSSSSREASSSARSSSSRARGSRLMLPPCDLGAMRQHGGQLDRDLGGIRLQLAQSHRRDALGVRRAARRGCAPRRGWGCRRQWPAAARRGSPLAPFRCIGRVSSESVSRRSFGCQIVVNSIVKFTVNVNGWSGAHRVTGRSESQKKQHHRRSSGAVL